jgi:hypothetical protein
MTNRLIAATVLLLVSPVLALDGQPGIHDPSTVVMHSGRYYTYGTGAGLPMLVSDGGWTWRRGGTVMQALPGGRPGADVIARGGNNTWAPDVIRVGEKYFLYYSAPGTQPKSAIGLLVGRTLQPDSPDYTWEDGGPVVWSDGVEDSNAIDPGVFFDPTTGSLWLMYGSYFGYIRLVELNPKTGKRLYPERKPADIAINSEASIIIFRDGWYYLLVTHGSCCAGANSTYNIRMGRAKKVAGPLPQPVAQHHRARRQVGIGVRELFGIDRDRVIFSEGPTVEWPDAEQLEQVPRRVAVRDALGLAGAGQRAGDGRRPGEPLEPRGQGLVVLEIGSRYERALDIGRLQARPHERQFLGMIVRQRTKQNSVRHAEQRHVAADAERQGEDDHRREQRPSNERANRVLEVANDVADHDYGCAFLQERGSFGTTLKPGIWLPRHAAAWNDLGERPAFDQFHREDGTGPQSTSDHVLVSWATA